MIELERADRGRRASWTRVAAADRAARRAPHSIICKLSCLKSVIMGNNGNNG